MQSKYSGAKRMRTAALSKQPSLCGTPEGTRLHFRFCENLGSSLSRYKNNPNPQMWFGLFFFGAGVHNGLRFSTIKYN
jgi:hypothetical protein